MCHDLLTNSDVYTPCWLCFCFRTPVSACSRHNVLIQTSTRHVATQDPKSLETTNVRDFVIEYIKSKVV